MEVVIDMRFTKKKHIVNWYDNATHEVVKLRKKVLSPDISDEDKLQHIRTQYMTLSFMDKVCDGEAFFVGFPRSKGAGQ